MVLALLGLILAVVPPVLGVGTDSARLRADTRGLAAALATARSEAILAGREVAFVVDAARRTYGLGGAMDGRLDDGMRVDLLTAV
ncbi:MAG TPA: GspH/FimT family pseudopilin, partial [Azospirillaceae bacterium]|nr:GspH/FimT family pseudopilin [Azospirillaceae bacterium]